MERILNVKALLEKQFFQQKSQAGPILTYSFLMSLKEMHAFTCNIRDLDNKPMSQISKRTIVEHFDLQYCVKDYMVGEFIKGLFLQKNVGHFKTMGETVFLGESVFMTVSYQDIIYLAKAFVYNMKMLEQEYFERLLFINKMKADKYKINIIQEEYKDDSFVFNESPRRGRVVKKFSFKEDKKSKNKKRMSYYVFSSKSAKEENIITVLSNAMKAKDQLKKASKAVGQYKKMAADYARKTSFVGPNDPGNNIRFRESTKNIMHRITNSGSLTVRGNSKLPTFGNKQSSDSENQVEDYPRLRDETNIAFKSFKIVSIHV